MSCPTCKRKRGPKSQNKYYPFCCERCQMADLGRWLVEEYRLPDDGSPPDDNSAN